MTPPGAALLALLRKDGLTLRLSEGRILVGPTKCLTPGISKTIRSNRGRLVAALQAEEDWPERAAAWRLLDETDATILALGARGHPRVREIADRAADAFCARDLVLLRSLCAEGVQVARGLKGGQ